MRAEGTRERQTSAGVAWTFHLVSAHVDVQRKMQEEIDRVLGDRRIPTYEARTQNSDEPGSLTIVNAPARRVRLAALAGLKTCRSSTTWRWS